MLDQATELPEPLKVDLSRLNLFPDPTGMQHDEIESMRDSYPAWWPQKLRFIWSRQVRGVHIEAPLHPSVFQRLETLEGVSHYGLNSVYRPENLATHLRAGRIYETAIAPAIRRNKGSL